MTPKVLTQMRPQVHEELRHWTDRARKIPSPDLREQALASVATKAFHCEGGGIYSLLAGEREREAVRFIVAYQTISDYLDNLCDRGTSLDPDDFRSLHTSMRDALTPGARAGDYYQYREERDDGGYLAALVTTCQEVLGVLPGYDAIAPHLHELVEHYSSLQVYKHVREDERVPLLETWFEEYRDTLPPMAWYEFAACAGSTLGIFCLVSRAAQEGCTPSLARRIRDAYFPWVQGLHILLDYLIDREEDRQASDLNFCLFYPDDREMVTRISHFYRQAYASVSALPDPGFHRLVVKGLLGIYCSDKKVHSQRDVQLATRKLAHLGGPVGVYAYFVCWTYRRMAASDPESARRPT
jgi:tetraprenyl-beta-curcumene synthase